MLSKMSRIVTVFLFIGFLSFNFSFIDVLAAESNDHTTITKTILNDHGYSVNVTLNEDIIDEISDNEILNIINDFGDNESVAIHDVVFENSEDVQSKNNESRLVGVTTYKTEKTYTSKNVFEKDHFIISVAKGQTTTLSSAKTAESNLSISGAYYDYAKLDFTKKETYTASVSDKFTGPTESSPNNTRLYYAREYVNKGSYKQYQCFNNFCSGAAKTGTFKEPSKFVLYSHDEKY